jgi:hypothetical protein
LGASNNLHWCWGWGGGDLVVDIGQHSGQGTYQQQRRGLGTGCALCIPVGCNTDELGLLMVVYAVAVVVQL